MLPVRADRPRFAEVPAGRRGACTIIARNYLAAATVLARSFHRHHPGLDFTTLIVDGTEEDRRRPGLGRVVLPEELALGAGEWSDMAACYDVMELATALKAALLTFLLAGSGGEPVVYLDPDIAVFHPFDEVFDDAQRHGIVLTPHVLQPFPRDGRAISERDVMAAGIFNLGFIAVGAGAGPFLAWWRERLRRDAIADPANCLFTDQRWIDWVPALFEHRVARDPGLNVAYWNLHERRLGSGVDGRPSINGRPLRFFHFSGFDPERPWLLSKHAGDHPRVLMSDSPRLRALCDGYAADLHSAAYGQWRAEPYGLGWTPNGIQLTPELRRGYRLALLEAEAGDGVRPPNPFLEPEAFADWYFRPSRGPSSARTSRHEIALWGSRIDLQAAFNDPVGDDAPAFRRWLEVDPAAPAALIRAWPQAPPDRFAPAPGPSVPTVPAPVAARGWSVIAYTHAELGVGEAGRRLARGCAQSGLPVEVVGVRDTLSRQQHPPPGSVGERVRFDNAIVCVNADRVTGVLEQMGLNERRERGRRVGLWFWEVDRVPEQWRTAMARLDEIWVASEFVKTALDRLGGCPVRVVPLPVAPSVGPTAYTRTDLGLPPDRTLFLCTYDFFSVLRRKNPIDVISAYTAAFGPADGAALVLKSINGHRAPAQLERIRIAAAGRPDIHVLDGYVTHLEMKAIIELSDCVVSLHRSEGYGLNLVDAMTLGRPVIATGYSGNLTFMDRHNSLLVPYVEVEVGPDADPYPADAGWAQPDVAAAAELMRRIFDDPAGAVRLGRRGQESIRREHGIHAAGARVRELMTDALEYA